jgi:predicted nuclease of predicted toxin-antitoxin system
VPQRRPDEPLIFLVDECLGKGVVHALREAGRRAEWSRDHFPEGTDDEVWIPKVAERGWVILSKDENSIAAP